MKETRQTTAKIVRALHRLRQSPLVWLCALLVGFDMLVAQARPLQYVHGGGFVPLDRHPVVAKIPEFLSSNVEPDVLVLGSSLPMYALTLCDALEEGIPHQKAISGISRYLYARTLEAKLSRLAGKPVVIRNLTVPGCMVSDGELILDRAIAAGKAPRMLVYGISPRDFSDNLVPPQGHTPVFELIGPPPDVRKLLTAEISPAEFNDRFWRHASAFFNVRSDYARLLTDLSCQWLKRPPDLYTSKLLAQSNRHGEAGGQMPEGQANEAASAKEEISAWNSRYNPPDRKRFDSEFQRLDSMLSTCRRRGITAVLVDMPLPRHNTDLIEPEIYKLYRQRLLALTKKHGALLVDMGAACELADSDYYDSAHPNGAGGRKIQERLVGALSGLLPI